MCSFLRLKANQYFIISHFSFLLSFHHSTMIQEFVSFHKAFPCTEVLKHTLNFTQTHLRKSTASHPAAAHPSCFSGASVRHSGSLEFNILSHMSASCYFRSREPPSVSGVISMNCCCVKRDIESRFCAWLYGCR